MKRKHFIQSMVGGVGGLLAHGRVNAEALKGGGAVDAKTAGASEVKIETSTEDVEEVVQEPVFVNTGSGFGYRIALTYDDGPTPGVTDVILEELAKRDLRATFFMIGSKVKAEPDLAKAVVDAGHEVANHTYTHRDLKRLKTGDVEKELKKTQEVISEATGELPVWFRPPYGSFRRKEQGPLASKESLGVAYWSVDPMDWKRPGVSRIVSRIVTRTTPGAIILLHDLKKQTAEATPQVLDGLQERDFRFTTLSGFLGDPYRV